MHFNATYYILELYDQIFTIFVIIHVIPPKYLCGLVSLMCKTRIEMIRIINIIYCLFVRIKTPSFKIVEYKVK